MHSNVTIKNVSWPHFSWPTLYIVVVGQCAFDTAELWTNDILVW